MTSEELLKHEQWAMHTMPPHSNINKVMVHLRALEKECRELKEKVAHLEALIEGAKNTDAACPFCDCDPSTEEHEKDCGK
jgi:DNA repair exonuclease SbcCD ATPase subunit